ncbi:MAG TPA: hypothetical protein PLJ47_13330, partial [Candidatus Hydrogenedentes bacterium]|nr:hypothetical protein [Candidatus Hydrogenedentota bacterium]
MAIFFDRQRIADANLLRQEEAFTRKALHNQPTYSGHQLCHSIPKHSIGCEEVISIFMNSSFEGNSGSKRNTTSSPEFPVLDDVYTWPCLVKTRARIKTGVPSSLQTV